MATSFALLRCSSSASARASLIDTRPPPIANLRISKRPPTTRRRLISPSLAVARRRSPMLADARRLLPILADARRVSLPSGRFVACSRRSPHFSARSMTSARADYATTTTSRRSASWLKWQVVAMSRRADDRATTLVAASCDNSSLDEPSSCSLDLTRVSRSSVVIDTDNWSSFLDDN